MINKNLYVRQRDFRLAEFDYKRFVVRSVHTIEEVQEPSYWQHVANHAHYGDRIEVISEQGDYWLELFVVRSEGIAIYTRPLQIQRWDEEIKINPDDIIEDAYKVSWGGGAKWRILRISDGVAAMTGIEDKQTAFRECAQRNEDHKRNAAQAKRAVA